MSVAGGTEVVVTEDTTYPFSDRIEFTVNSGKPVRWTWIFACGGAHIWVGG